MIDLSWSSIRIGLVMILGTMWFALLFDRIINDGTE